VMNSRRLTYTPPKLKAGIVPTKTSALEGAINVRFGSLADIRSAKAHVRFTPESGHVQCNSVCPLSANSGHQGN
jgi:hypothetical protein